MERLGTLEEKKAATNKALLEVVEEQGRSAPLPDTLADTAVTSWKDWNQTTQEIANIVKKLGVTRPTLQANGRPVRPKIAKKDPQGSSDAAVPTERVE